MSRKLSILCFGDSLTAGFYSYGREYRPYAIKLKEHLEYEYLDLEVLTTVAGQPGDLVCCPGAFLSRIEMECDNNQYDWVIFLGGTKWVFSIALVAVFLLIMGSVRRLVILDMDSVLRIFTLVCKILGLLLSSQVPRFFL
jgi:hypothetical protein